MRVRFAGVRPLLAEDELAISVEEELTTLEDKRRREEEEGSSKDVLEFLLQADRASSANRNKW